MKEYKLKFDIGDKVFAIVDDSDKDNNEIEVSVYGIEVERYNIDSEGAQIVDTRDNEYTEDMCFKTKDEVAKKIKELL
jgi:hypothetical protein